MRWIFKCVKVGTTIKSENDETERTIVIFPASKRAIGKIKLVIHRDNTVMFAFFIVTTER